MEITQPDCRLDRRLKTRHVFFPDNSPFDESLYNGTCARMSNQLGRDEHWQGNQKSYLHLNIMKKGKPAYASCLRAHTIEEQQRQPCD